MEFRLLRKDEIECRVARVNENSVKLLLYKDARCDQKILDETVGCMNWQRHHSRNNANCIVSIWDSDKGIWVEKEDTGTESNTESEKGLASDSFKRACFNWGIGRELYTSPKDISFWSNEANIKSGKCYDSFYVTDIEYDGQKIKTVTILNKDTGKSKTFKNDGKITSEKHEPEADQIQEEIEKDKKKTGEIGKMKIAPVKAQALISKCEAEGVSVSELCKVYKVKGVTELTESMYRNINEFWSDVKAKCGK